MNGFLTFLVFKGLGPGYPYKEQVIEQIWAAKNKNKKSEALKILLNR